MYMATSALLVVAERMKELFEIRNWKFEIETRVRLKLFIWDAVVTVMEMETPKTMPVERSWFFEGVSEAAQFTGRLAKNFFKTLAFGAAFTALLGVVVYIAARGGPAWRAPLAFGLVVIGAGVVAFMVSGNLAVVLSLAQTVRAKGLAKRVLDGLFAELLGVSAETPEGDLELTRSLHGMPVEEVRGKLRRAGEAMLENRVALALPGFVRWLARKAQAALVWATVWVVGAYATAKSDQEKKVDLLALRGSLTAVVDDLVTARITEGAIRLGLLLAVGVCLGAWGLVAALVRFAP